MSERIRANTLTEVYRIAAERFRGRPAFASKNKDGDYVPISYDKLYDTGLNLAEGLISRGLEAKEHVGLLSDNRLEWIIADYGVLLAGAADVPRAADVTPDEIEYILGHCDARFAFVESLSVLDRVESVRQKLPKLEFLILLDPNLKAPAGVLSLNSLIEEGAALRKGGSSRAEERAASVSPDDLFTLIYTSGTTGLPKGVQLTHANMCSQIRNLPFPLEPDDSALSILPVWHSYERVFEMVAIGNGVCTYYTSLRSIAPDLQKVKPTVMASAPRLWENLYERMLSKIKTSSPIKQLLFQTAYASTREVQRARLFFKGQELDVEGRSLAANLRLALRRIVGLLISYIPCKLLDAIVLKKLRDVVGGNFRGTISGGGALPPHVDEFFNFVGIPVLEGYGLTETAPVLAVRTWDDLVIGTVGPIWPETEVRIVDLNSGAILHPDRKAKRFGSGRKGEIHVRGPQVMRGYYKNPEATDAVLRDGWLNTGDIGMMTFNGCLKILGRSKETIVLLSGENIEPTPIENKLCESPLISQAIVVGQDAKHLGALIYPNVEEFQKLGINASCAGDLDGRQEVIKVLSPEIRKLVSGETGFKPFERIAAWRVIPKGFEVGDEMTRTFKLKRHVIHEKYADEIRGISGRTKR